MHDGITKIAFKNYKSFPDDHQAEMDLSVPICLIIGRNNSGKSSVIDVIEYIYKLEDNIKPIDIDLSFIFDENHLGAFQENAFGGKIRGNHLEYGKMHLGNTIVTNHQISSTPFSKERMRCLKFNKLLLPKGKEIYVKALNEWNAAASLYSNYANNIIFRRINAERDITPEPESKELIVDYNGRGATNLIRHFLNNSQFDETVVEKLLLDELNTIMSQDAYFENIRIQQVEDGNSLLWEIFLKEKGQNRFALSQSGSGLKTIILILINILLIPKLEDNNGKKFVFAFEELENNLHPSLQRRLFEYLYKYAMSNHDDRIFITTHSHVAINVFYGQEYSNIFHVIKENGRSSIKYIDNYLDKVEILEDLDVKASDLLQSNGIIWVEGPSDRIYIKRWLEVFTENAFTEGRDYQFIYYGGSLLKYYEANGDKSIEELISILITNRNAAIVMDSDKKNSNSQINKTKKRINEEFSKHGLMCWITKGKEIENYITFSCINRAFKKELKNDIGQYELFPDYIEHIYKGFSDSKVQFAKKIAPFLDKTDDKLDLSKQIKKLYNNIKIWNI